MPDPVPDKLTDGELWVGECACGWESEPEADRVVIMEAHAQHRLDRSGHALTIWAKAPPEQRKAEARAALVAAPSRPEGDEGKVSRSAQTNSTTTTSDEEAVERAEADLANAQEALVEIQALIAAGREIGVEQREPVAHLRAVALAEARLLAAFREPVEEK